MNPIGQNFPQRDVKSMSEIVYTGIMEIKQLFKTTWMQGLMFSHEWVKQLV